MASMEITLAFGILFGLLWSRRTGWNCGGLITPGILALHANMPLGCLCSLVTGVILAPVLDVIAQRGRLYGRERIGAAMLLALAARCLSEYLFPMIGNFISVPLWLGWVVPGLIAADIQRQGTFITLAGSVAVSIAAVFASSLAADFLKIIF
ncbi:MAG: poly-gamma-glutamate biosynthesis protein PgsC/CapC [Synergistaceae bacterium]|nr:poly-gamma-glutamate biosynthesis protein PgsC/CapC [Synergistaceae bacterium]